MISGDSAGYGECVSLLAYRIVRQDYRRIVPGWILTDTVRNLSHSSSNSLQCDAIFYRRVAFLLYAATSLENNVTFPCQAQCTVLGAATQSSMQYSFFVFNLCLGEPYNYEFFTSNLERQNIISQANRWFSTRKSFNIECRFRYDFNRQSNKRNRQTRVIEKKFEMHALVNLRMLISCLYLVVTQGCSC